MPEIVSDEYREGYAAFNLGVTENPYLDENKYLDWEHGWIDAEFDWKELIGVEKDFQHV